ncbi:unnamed protein product [Fusarium equiseti]|uniref:Methyltransferase n=1 Tax=Fusarium equiseti TaxID=61235 RepID=A0A8J2IV29_FUSEQ|nr:unnamed protein product [Fusarium equiseti]
MAAADIRSPPFKELYSQWGTSYDQGRVNNMQGLDYTELETLYPKFISLLQQSFGSSTSSLKRVDFGCGTGRNTLKLIAMLPGARDCRSRRNPNLAEHCRETMQGSLLYTA